MRMRVYLVAAWLGLVGGYVGSVVAQPTGRDYIDQAISITNTAVDALDVSGGAQFGSGDVALVGADGKLNGPLSSTILDDLSGANLTALNASNLGSGTMPMARQPANVIVDLVTDWEDVEQSTQSTTTWSDTGLSATITVDNATNDLEIDVWQMIEFSTGSVEC